MFITPATPILLALAFAAAQPTPPRPATLQPVDPGTVDLSANALSTRVMRIDQRLPTGFDQVFRVNPANGAALPTDKPMFARKSGALTAIFPRSAYHGTESGAIVPIVPAGTRFMIGDEVVTPAAPTPARTPSWNAVDRRAGGPVDRVASNATHQAVGRAASVETTVPAVQAADLPPGMLTDDAYRVRRVAELLRRAADVDR